MGQKRNVMIISAIEDRNFLSYFQKHLRPLEAQGLITVWDASQLVAGTERQREINAHLLDASIILLLLSANLMASEDEEIKRAVARNAPPDVYVVPILLHAVDWEHSDLGGLSPLPANGRPVSRWTDYNVAFFEIVKGIRRIIEHMADLERLIPLEHSTPDHREPQEAHRRTTLTHRCGDHFDVFLCYNKKDRSEVRVIAKRLQEKRIVPWFDEWELRPGLPWQRALEQQISKINTAAVFVGAQDIGPWQNMEIDAFLREFVHRSCPVIPTLLETANDEPRLPLFLAAMTWVDFRVPEPDPLGQLIWAITNEKPAD